MFLVVTGTTALVGSTQVEAVREVLPEAVTAPVDTVLKPVYGWFGISPPSAAGGAVVAKYVNFCVLHVCFILYRKIM